MGFFADLLANPWQDYLIRLAFSAARWDGQINEKEKAAILNIARMIRDNKAVPWEDRLIQQGLNSNVPPEKDRELLLERKQESFAVWFFVVYWMLSVFQADGTMNAKEMEWLRRFEAATHSSGDPEDPLSILLGLFCNRESKANGNQQFAETLGISSGAGLEEIGKAYRLKASEFHPDKLAGVSTGVKLLAEQQMKQINEAYKMMTLTANSKVDLTSMVALNPASRWISLQQVKEHDIIYCSICYQQNRMPQDEKFMLARCGRCHLYLVLDHRQADIINRATGRRFEGLPEEKDI